MGGGVNLEQGRASFGPTLFAMASSHRKDAAFSVGKQQESGLGLAESDPQFHHCGSATAFVLWRFGDCRDVGVLLEHLTQGLAQDAHAAAVNDTDTRQAS